MTYATLADWFVALGMSDPVTDTAINDQPQGEENPDIEEEDVPLVKSDPVPEETE